MQDRALMGNSQAKYFFFQDFSTFSSSVVYGPPLNFRIYYNKLNILVAHLFLEYLLFPCSLCLRILLPVVISLMLQNLPHIDQVEQHWRISLMMSLGSVSFQYCLMDTGSVRVTHHAKKTLTVAVAS